MTRKAMFIDLEDWMQAEIQFITSAIGSLSPDKVVSEIVKYALGSSSVIQTIFEPYFLLCHNQQQQCTGTCQGMGTATTQRGSRCPDPCDETILDELEVTAKLEARIAAIRNCGGDPNCLCADGEYKTLIRTCETIAVQMGQICKYTVTARYTGTCKVVS